MKVYCLLFFSITIIFFLRLCSLLMTFVAFIYILGNRSLRTIRESSIYMMTRGHDTDECTHYIISNMSLFFFD